MKSKLKRAKNGMLTYIYGDKNFSCKFNMLCEVGEPWQAEFKRIIAGRGYIIKTCELAEKPYIADFAI